MDGLALASASNLLSPNFTSRRRPETVARRELRLRARKLPVVVAAKGKGNEGEEGEDQGKVRLDKWDQMELKFGRYLGEDPKLTLAKIMARKENPGSSMLEVEKSFYRNKGKMVKIEELPFDVPGRLKKLSSSADGLDLVRPVPRKGDQLETKGGPTPPSQKMNEPRKPVTNSASKRSVSNVSLRRPTIYLEDDLEDRPKRDSYRVMARPTLTLKMGSDRRKETFSNVTLLRKPEPAVDDVKEEEPGRVDVIDESAVDARGYVASTDDLTKAKESENGITLTKKPETLKSGTPKSMEGLHGPIDCNDDGKESVEEVEEHEMRDGLSSGMQPATLGKTELIERDALVAEPSDPALNGSASTFSQKTALQAKPRRLDPSAEEASSSSVKSPVIISAGSFDSVDDLRDRQPPSAMEDADWSRAENLVKTGDRGEVELISASLSGFTVLFDSLVGFLPYRNLTTKWKFLAFESWLRQKGLDPPRYRQNFHIFGSCDAVDNNPPSVLTNGPGFDRKAQKEITADMKLKDLQVIYDEEKLKFFSSFVGQRIRVYVVVADRKLKKLTVSVRPREKEEVVEKKRNLMAKLQVGDVVSCCIKKITYYGIFVEIEDVSALIHQTEISWDATLNPLSYYKVGQMVEAKVIQLDFTRERIYLSLKETMPDPLTKTLDHLIGDRDPLDGTLEAAESDAEWPEVDMLIEELQQIEGVQTVSKGRFSLSPGLAPTFQVYMASIYDNQYKLLARAGNKVQEVIVQASLSKEEMASTISSCANRVK